MNKINIHKPVILVLAGHDPIGGAGIQADIEAIASQGCQAVVVMTSLTAQNTSDVGTVTPQDAGLFREQLELLLDDMTISACKIGLVTGTGIVDVIQDILSNRIGPLPVVHDPVITSGSGHVFVSEPLIKALCAQLLPLATVCTPNSSEARALTGVDDHDSAARKILDLGAESVLITGADHDEDPICNRLYSNNSKPLEYKWDRLAGHYHGSGCTLSASLAANLGAGEPIEMAVQKAQVYTWNALKYAGQYGKSQLHPDRFFWARK